MDRFQAIRTFREVARQGGFAAAARALNVSPPTVTRLITELEADLGVRLFSRSTRNISLTEEGEQFLHRGVPLLEELEVVTEEIRESKDEPQGHLRVTSVASFGQERVTPILAGFLERYPKVTAELDISNRKVDLVQEHYDLAIRIGGSEGLDTPALKARKIYEQKLIFVATPGYVERYGTPESLDQLTGHQIVKQISGTWGIVNDFRYGDRQISHNLQQNFVVNSPVSARNAILTGRTMGLLPDYLAADQIAAGSLIRLLPGFETLEQPIYAVFVHRNFMPAKVRAFIDYLVEELGSRPDV